MTHDMTPGNETYNPTADCLDMHIYEIKSTSCSKAYTRRTVLLNDDCFNRVFTFFFFKHLS